MDLLLPVVALLTRSDQAALSPVAARAALRSCVRNGSPGKWVSAASLKSSSAWWAK